MSEPRWTVDEDGWLISPSGRTAIASWDHDDAEDASARIRADEFDALVAAVRDADTLRQARLVAALIERLPNDYTPEGRLLDLLAPAPDTGAEHEARADRIWGPGNWIVCGSCPRDSLGNKVRHHKDAHAVPDPGVGP